MGGRGGGGGGRLEKTKKLPAPSSAALALTVWSLPVSQRTRVSWQLLAGSSKGSSFSCSRPAVLLQRVEKGSDGGPGVRPGAQGNNWESLELEWQAIILSLHSGCFGCHQANRHGHSPKQCSKEASRPLRAGTGLVQVTPTLSGLSKAVTDSERGPVRKHPALTSGCVPGHSGQ